MEKRISSLKKVHLHLSISDKKKRSICKAPQPFVFIYGCASTGLNPFELELADKMEGEKLQMELKTSELAGKLGHLHQQMRHALGVQILPSELKLQVKIGKVENADEREIIQAIAGSLGSSCGGNCDCGCS